MNKRFIYLMEKYFEKTISQSEEQELNNLLHSNSTLKTEFEDQKQIKGVLNKMKMKNPSSEVWDVYWLGIYRKLERGLSWIFISIGAVILLSYSVYQAAEQFFFDPSTPEIIKWGVTIFFIGTIILLISLIREKIFTSKRDKYKEIQR
ncbi:MAG TPA: hypothetical protein VK870_01625 [Ignavibacteriaceae bacterium]|nr:hypothetical protein [Ignavibacteriaceae bacterium]